MYSYDKHNCPCRSLVIASAESVLNKQHASLLSLAHTIQSPSLGTSSFVFPTWLRVISARKVMSRPASQSSAASRVLIVLEISDWFGWVIGWTTYARSSRLATFGLCFSRPEWTKLDLLLSGIPTYALYSNQWSGNGGGVARSFGAIIIRLRLSGLSHARFFTLQKLK